MSQMAPEVYWSRSQVSTTIPYGLWLELGVGNRDNFDNRSSTDMTDMALKVVWGREGHQTGVPSPQKMIGAG